MSAHYVTRRDAAADMAERLGLDLHAVNAAIGAHGAELERVMRLVWDCVTVGQPWPFEAAS